MPSVALEYQFSALSLNVLSNSGSLSSMALGDDNNSSTSCSRPRESVIIEKCLTFCSKPLPAST